MNRRALPLSGATVLAASVLAAAGLTAIPATASAAASQAVTLSQTSLDFGSQEVGSVSAAQSVTITNTSGQQQSIFTTLTDVPGDVSGSFIEFTQLNAPGSSQPGCDVTLAPGASCTLSITFKPDALQRQTADLVVHGAGQTLATALLSGKGTTAGMYVGSVTVPSSVTGGQTVTGTVHTASTPSGSDCKTAPTDETVHLSAAAWDSVNGTIVNVASVPNAITVPAGTCEANFTLTTSSVSASIPGSVKASAADDPDDYLHGVTAAFQVIR